MIHATVGSQRSAPVSPGGLYYLFRNGPQPPIRNVLRESGQLRLVLPPDLWDPDEQEK